MHCSKFDARRLIRSIFRINDFPADVGAETLREFSVLNEEYSLYWKFVRSVSSVTEFSASLAILSNERLSDIEGVTLSV